MPKLAIILLVGTVIFNICIYRIMFVMKQSRDKEIQSQKILVDKEDAKEVLELAIKQVHPDGPNKDKEKYMKYKDLYAKI